MSEGFHVHGPHDHEVEHKAHSGDTFAARIAVMTAMLATVGALISYQGGATQNAALLFKNEAAIKKTEASDQWNFYQAKSSKQNLAELGATLTTGKTSDDYRAGGRALQEGEGKDHGGREGAENRPAGRRCEERRVDAPAPPLGAIDGADPDRHRARRHHAADAPEMAAVDGLRRRHSAALSSPRSRSRTSERGAHDAAFIVGGST